MCCRTPQNLLNPALLLLLLYLCCQPAIILLLSPGKGKGKGKGDEFKEQVVQVRRVTKVVKGGKQMKFRAVVVVGVCHGEESV